MSAPVQVQIKRKYEDEPVQFLHVHNEVNGIHQTNRVVFVRTRKKARIFSPDKEVTSTTSFTETVHPSTLPASQPRTGLQSDSPNISLVETTATIQRGPPLSAEVTQPQEPRRFYFSRPTQHNAQDGLVQGKAPPKVFMEKKTRRVTTKSIDASPNPQHDIVNQQANVKSTSPSNPNAAPLVDRPQAPLRGNTLPSGRIMPRDATVTKLESEIQAYTLQLIGENLAQTSASDTRSSSSSLRKSTLRFKPKPPLQRYKERHPEVAAEDQIMIDGDDESGYVVDTYVRMPIEMLESLEPTKNYGLLVLDSQPDIDDFYNGDSDDESEIQDEEEDENAENHPSTDYPEDEVDSNEEFGRRGYSYRNRNTSDDEEFDDYYDDDDEGGTFSDDDTESWKPAWARRN